VILSVSEQQKDQFTLWINIAEKPAMEVTK